MFPVRYEMNLYILHKKNAVFEILTVCDTNIWMKIRIARQLLLKVSDIDLKNLQSG
jgi:hypothetical protein